MRRKISHRPIKVNDHRLQQLTFPMFMRKKLLAEGITEVEFYFTDEKNCLEIVPVKAAKDGKK